MRRRNLLISCRNSQRLNKTYFRTSKTDTSLRNKTDPGHVIQPGPSIPNDQYLAGSVTQQVHKKQNDLWAADRTGEQPEIEVPPRHPCHPRKRFTVEMMQYRRLPSWCPVRQRWGRSLNPLSSMKTIVRPSWWAFFLISGRRSSARRAPVRVPPGAGIQPNCRTMRHACAGCISHRIPARSHVQHAVPSTVRSRTPAPQVRV
jgi:hypothetical protein